MATEKRLIDANALQKEIERIYSEHYEKSCYKFIHDFFRAMLRRIRICPTVDAVEVVRCEECVHCYQLIVDKNGFWQEVEKGGTDNLCRRNETTFDVRCDDFCSYGERK